MSRTTTRLFLLFALLAGVGLWSPAVHGQTVTSGAIAGIAVDQQGGVLPGVSVSAVHVPTGTSYEAVTDSDGNFTIPNVRVGGPYTIKATLSGFRDGELTDV